MAGLQRFTLIVALLMVIGCKKQHETVFSPTTHIYKIEVMTGDNQTDTVGHPLKNEVELRILRDGEPFPASVIEYTGTGCLTKESIDITTSADGTSLYNWYLSADPGVQTLTVVLKDLKNNKLDSLTMHATALASSGTGILASACSFGGIDNGIPVFYKLNSGRLIAAFNGAPKYSDDNGVSWYPITALSNSFLRKMVVTPDDRLFALVNQGLVYSQDKGITWSVLVHDNTFNKTIYDLDYTRGGILSYSSGISTINLSMDNGLTWKKVSMPADDHGYLDLAQQPNGDMFILGQEKGGIYKSGDDGATWKPLTSKAGPQTQYSSLFIDGNGYIYLGRTEANGGIYVSKDNGQSIIKITFSPDIYSNFSNPDRISKQHDGSYFIHTPLQGTFRTYDFSHIENVNTRYNLTTSDCIVANNNSLVVIGNKFSELSYIPKQ